MGVVREIVYVTARVQRIPLTRGQLDALVDGWSLNIFRLGQDDQKIIKFLCHELGAKGMA